MAKVSNVKRGASAVSDADSFSQAAPFKKTHAGGRRINVGETKSAGGPGVKERHLKESRNHNLGHKHIFRSGAQDARKPNSPGGHGGLGAHAIEGGSGPTGAVSPTPAQLKKRRSGLGATMMTPAAHGRE